LLAYLAKRLLLALPVALGVGLVCFLLVYLAPGDPISASVSADTPQEVIDQLRRDYGLDKPLPLQFAGWVSRVAQGDLGTSIATGRPVADEIRAAGGNTMILGLAAAAIGFPLGIVLGFLGGWFRGSWVDRGASLAGVIGVSVPHYWLGMVLVAIFSVWLGVMPAMGAGPVGGSWLWDWEHLRFLLLPAIALSVIPMAITMRTVRAAVGDTLDQEFVEALHAKGLSSRRILMHVVKNTAATTLAVVGLQFGYLLGGSILVEIIFSWPGTGMLMNNAISQRDLPLLQGTVVVLAMFFVALNLIVDVLQTVIDPRIVRS
jgi:peptide/nickel transport system permease protein